MKLSNVQRQHLFKDDRTGGHSADRGEPEGGVIAKPE
jgi:hypothetical protein